MRLRRARNVIRTGKRNNTHRTSSPVEKPKRQYEDNIMMDLRGLDCKDRRCTELAQIVSSKGL
jgi:hypothetical protein